MLSHHSRGLENDMLLDFHICDEEEEEDTSNYWMLKQTDKCELHALQPIALFRLEPRVHLVKTHK